MVLFRLDELLVVQIDHVVPDTILLHLLQVLLPLLPFQCLSSLTLLLFLLLLLLFRLLVPDRVSTVPPTETLEEVITVVSRLDLHQFTVRDVIVLEAAAVLEEAIFVEIRCGQGVPRVRLVVVVRRPLIFHHHPKRLISIDIVFEAFLAFLEDVVDVVEVAALFDGGDTSGQDHDSFALRGRVLN